MVFVRFLSVQLTAVLLLMGVLYLNSAIAEQTGETKSQIKVFEEIERVYELAPSRQSVWANQYASKHSLSTDIKGLRKSSQKAFPNDPPGMIAQIDLIAYLFITGDTIAAVDGYLNKNPDTQGYGKIKDKLNKLSRTRSNIIQKFANKKPPRAYAGDDPELAARTQDKSKRYTQYVQLSTQLMNEIQNTERELVDILQTMKRDLDNLWQAYASMRDNDFRTKERL